MPRALRLNPNEEIVLAMKKEQTYLRNTNVFFVCLNIKTLPSRRFLDNWLNMVWVKNLGVYVSFCKMIQHGLFFISLKNHNMQKRVVEKKYWNVGNLLFKAIQCAPNVSQSDFLFYSIQRWIMIKNVLVRSWRFITKLLEPIGKNPTS